MEENNKNENIKEIIKNIESVENMTSSRGNIIANQFEIKGKGWVLFQSYSSPIAMFKDGQTYIFRDWDYSTTTGKYRNIFLSESKAETKAKLQSGEYIAVDFEVY